MSESYVGLILASTALLKDWDCRQEKKQAKKLFRSLIQKEVNGWDLS